MFFHSKICLKFLYTVYLYNFNLCLKNNGLCWSSDMLDHFFQFFFLYDYKHIHTYTPQYHLYGRRVIFKIENFILSSPSDPKYMRVMTKKKFMSIWSDVLPKKAPFERHYFSLHLWSFLHGMMIHYSLKWNTYFF